MCARPLATPELKANPTRARDVSKLGHLWQLFLALAYSPRRRNIDATALNWHSPREVDPQMKNLPLSRFFRLIPPLFVSLLTILTLLSPAAAVAAAMSGLKLWWDAVLPALLPFFILSEILLSLGVVHWLGALIDPLMRPLFDVPGAGGFALAMGLSSGYPMGPRLAARLTKEGLVNRVEGERLAAFTNCAGPLFITGAIAVGIFREPDLAAPLAAAHYTAAIATGLVMRFWGPPTRNRASHVSKRRVAAGGDERLFARAYRAFEKARSSENRPFGQILSDAVRDGLNTLLLIGGFIVLFSVIMAVLSRYGILNLLEAPVGHALSMLGASPALAAPLLQGLLEVTSGSGAIAKASAPLWQRAVAESALLAWAGLCVHSQARSSPGASAMRYAPFLLGRALQTAFAVLFMAVFLGPLREGVTVMRVALPVVANIGYGQLVLATLKLAGGWLLALVAAALLLHAIAVVRRRFSIIIFRSAPRRPKPTRP